MCRCCSRWSGAAANQSPTLLFPPLTHLLIYWLIDSLIDWLMGTTMAPLSIQSGVKYAKTLLPDTLMRWVNSCWMLVWSAKVRLKTKKDISVNKSPLFLNLNVWRMWCVIWRIWSSWNQPCVKTLMSWEVTAAPHCGSTLYWRGRLQQNQNQNICTHIPNSCWAVCDKVSLKNSSGSIQEPEEKKDPHNNPGPVLLVFTHFRRHIHNKLIID